MVGLHALHLKDVHHDLGVELNVLRKEDPAIHELRPRLVHHLLHVDGITRDAKSVTDSLCGEGQSILSR